MMESIKKLCEWSRFERWRKERRLFKMVIAANRGAEQAYRLGDYKYGDWLFKRAQQLAAEYDKLMGDAE